MVAQVLQGLEHDQPVPRGECTSRIVCSQQHLRVESVQFSVIRAGRPNHTPGHLQHGQVVLCGGVARVDGKSLTIGSGCLPWSEL
jgi:hypothetical protein